MSEKIFEIFSSLFLYIDIRLMGVIRNYLSLPIFKGVPVQVSLSIIFGFIGFFIYSLPLLLWLYSLGLILLDFRNIPQPLCVVCLILTLGMYNTPLLPIGLIYMYRMDDNRNVIIRKLFG